MRCHGMIKMGDENKMRTEECREPTYMVLSDYGLVYVVLAICIGIVISCSIAGYCVSYNKALKHYDNDVRKYATPLFEKWRGEFVRKFNKEQKEERERMGK